MSKVSRIFALLLVLAMFVSACGGTGPIAVDDAPAQVEDGAADAEAAASDDSDSEATEASDADASSEDDSDAAMASGDSPYPQQYATIEEYSTATSNSIDGFGEAPMLADMVAAGDLPALDERLTSEPAVVEPLESVGTYGGELAGPSTNPTCCGWDVLEMRLQKLFTIDTDLSTIIPNIAKGIDISDDQTEFTIHLRAGHKWSDGEPFTTEDFRFYFEDVISNEELTASPPGLWTSDGELAQFEVIDETTVKFTYTSPKPSLIVSLGTEVGNRGFRPAHYFKQFHADYNEEVAALAEEQGFEDWIQMFNSKMTPYNFTWNLGAETDSYAPTLNSFVFVSEDSFGNKLYERNPYFFKVDTAGNQLPYTDSLRRILVEDLQVQDLKGIAGEYSHYGWGQLLSAPTYRDNEEAGNYRTALVTYDRGNEYVFMFNFTTEDEVLRELFWDERFRQAMSLAINREEINELVYFGLATPSQAAPPPSSQYYQDWMKDHFATYDPEQANALLDEIGLDERDADGFRLRPDGETLFLNLQVSVPEEAWQKIGELTTDYWNAVGVKTNYKLIENGLYGELRDGNQLDVAAWGYDVTDIGDIGNGLTNLRPDWGARSAGVLWQAWFNSDGEEGEEPPAEIIELWEKAEEFLALPYGSDEQIALGTQLYEQHFDSLYMIGTIQYPPQPLLFKKNLRNTPPNDTTGLWSWSYRQWVQFMPEQWYFEE
ncbi:MAG: ABC transporter substrate-binding protein [Chloroflexota bacterium]